MARWSSPGTQRVADVIRERAGLVFPDARIADVEAAIRRAMARHDMVDAGKLIPLLEEDASARDALVAELTVGESYFQRDPAQFDVLREQVIPKLLANRTPDRSVRVWSAGCAAGEEAYTMTMLFDELGAAHRAKIVGTDISRPRLADAQRGVYSPWSLRITPDDLRRRYFRQRGRYFELTREIRSRVDFRYLNLAEDRFPSFSTGIWGMDIILCRNVLIYFDHATVERAARRLIATLSADGCLILGASDPPIADLVECDVVTTDAGLLYRRHGAALAAFPGPGGLATTPPRRPASHDAAAEPVETPLSGAGQATERQADERDASSRAGDASRWERPDADADGQPAATLLERYARRDFEEVCQMAASREDCSLTEAEWIAWLRALANSGRVGDAREVAVRAMTHCGATAELLCLDAVLLLAAGDPAGAAAVARQALYLDRELVVGHMVLANARQRTRDRAGARRALKNAAALLERLPPKTVVPGADGESAGRLAELVKVNLRVLSDDA